MRKIKKGDDVVIITGKDKGRRGKVLRVLVEDRVVVEGVNVVKKHQRPNPQKGVTGGIVEKEMPLQRSNVMLWNPVTKKGDDVVVITGKDKGRRGKVLRVLVGDRLVVEGVNVVKKHQKPNPQKGVQGGIIEREMSLEKSNVMLWNPVTKKGDRVGIKVLADGKRVRIFKSNGEAVDA